MNPEAPKGSRPACRVLLFDPSGSILLRACFLPGRDFWICPGGGLEEGETWEQAAHREVLEETGLSITLGPFIWFRRHAYSAGGRQYDLYEHFFVGYSASEHVVPRQQDSYVLGHCWWQVHELLTADAEFAPRRLKELIVPVMSGNISAPFDCGV